MFFESVNFIKESSNSDKFLQLVYPNGNRFYNLNVCQNKKIVLDKKIIRIYQEGNQSQFLGFENELDARAAFDALNTAVDNLRKNCATELSTSPQSNSGYKRFKKDVSLTSQHIGLLAMQKVEFLVEEPQTIDDISVLAILANTSPAIPGEKGVYKLMFDNIKKDEPDSMIKRVVFNGNRNPRQGNGLYFQDGNFTIYFTEEDNLVDYQNGWIKSGLTLDDTIANIVAFYNANPNTFTQEYSRIVETGTLDEAHNFNKYIDFEINYNRPDDEKYIQAQGIITPYQAIDFQSALIYDYNSFRFIDQYNEVVIINLDSNGPNVDGYILVIDVGGVETFNLYVKDNLFYYYNNSIYIVYTNWARDNFGTITIGNGVDASIMIGTVMRPYFEGTDIFEISTLRQLTTSLAQDLQSIYNSNNHLVEALSWDSNSHSHAIIDYSALYRNDSGQPNGTLGAFGLKYFADDQETIDAMNWAFSNPPGNWFSQMYDIVTPLNQTSVNRYEAIQIQPEFVRNSILGCIIGIDGDEVLIDDSNIISLKLSSVQDGAMGLTPYVNDEYSPFAIAWRNGTVIDSGGYYNSNGPIDEQTYIKLINLGAAFRPLSAALPGGTFYGDNKFIYFGK